ncbi:AzlC family ABC transporter permease [Companilactobacillus sp.]|jgi:4-azaleucine resistance transporter AzlC|uniref:AzlC family ABC transporter permease n=1 Tax=Companilactobacillus sp. TaxID=2767905 RepID=UPI0025BD6C6D|nr:AzlC family ABC transporter permease [Companilactobacillus sp.]MCH4010050.1 AzlC family ABC transporter permease [Companilactobacillus sp.]MCH4052274.1 AzlC family ABC transporter permease [Companilactobacillus sp.]MCH4077992.1 AzlC family ABC transporter permease [Companilactobacillus sp.]MCH4126568.1 AzlC family ABC transporter permease [Companilactobacillus sp.]MCH4132154.1 AzlC family ABC transporter permease [Companilactobacillus sp.]
MDDQLDIRTAVKDTLPTVFGYIGIGIAFGVVGKASGLSTFIVILTSLITYAGSAQFVLVGMLASHSPMLTIIFSVFLVNSRMILMSTTVARYFKKDSLLKNILVGSLLTDETFALSMSKLNYTNGKLNFEWFNTSNLIAYITWALSSFIGALLGNLITDPEKFGLDFALVAMFIGLLYLQLISDKSIKFNLQLIMIGITLALIYFGLIFIPSNMLILVVTIIACAIGVILKHAFF